MSEARDERTTSDGDDIELTDADRTATSGADGDLDEAGEDEQMDESFVTRAGDADPGDRG